MVDVVQTSYSYIDASGKTVDLAFKDENIIAPGCLYLMLHCAKSMFLGYPNKKNNMVSKLVLKNLLNVVTRP
jgi:hypothetical protein